MQPLRGIHMSADMGSSSVLWAPGPILDPCPPQDATLFLGFYAQDFTMAFRLHSCLVTNSKPASTLGGLVKGEKTDASLLFHVKVRARQIYDLLWCPVPSTHFSTSPHSLLDPSFLLSSLQSLQGNSSLSLSFSSSPFPSLSSLIFNLFSID